MLKCCILYSHILSFFQSAWEFDYQNGYNAIQVAIISEKDLIFYQSVFDYAYGVGLLYDLPIYIIPGISNLSVHRFIHKCLTTMQIPFKPLSLKTTDNRCDPGPKLELFVISKDK